MIQSGVCFVVAYKAEFIVFHIRIWNILDKTLVVMFLITYSCLFEKRRYESKIDYRTSHDFEDIIYVLDNRTTIVEEIRVDEKEIREFLKQELNEILRLSNTYEVLSCHIHPLVLEDRYSILEGKIKRIVELD